MRASHLTFTILTAITIAALLIFANSKPQTTPTVPLATPTPKSPQNEPSQPPSPKDPKKDHFMIGNLETVIKKYFTAKREGRKEKFLTKSQLTDLFLEFFTGATPAHIHARVLKRKRENSKDKIFNTYADGNLSAKSLWQDPDIFQYMMVTTWVNHKYQPKEFSQNYVKQLLKDGQIFFDKKVFMYLYQDFEKLDIKFNKYVVRNGLDSEYILDPKTIQTKKRCPKGRPIGHC
jgi:hypothetical protein